MKQLFTIILLALLHSPATDQKRVCTTADSIRIETILQRSINGSTSTAGERVIAIAEEFIGEKYVGGTLEQASGEPLYISCEKLDCTTFVELVLAIAMSADEGGDFTNVCNNLETIRYRNGKNNGYTSRLHYISWWITDSAKIGIVEDVTSQTSKKRQFLHLNFMSTHPSSYPILSENPGLVDEIIQQEIPYRGIEVCYIPKEDVGYTEYENIKPGDIVAITTSIPGLDVTHIGFAHYHNGTLCLIHASSGKGKVIKDITPLRDYLANNRRHTGIRVFRPVF